MRRFAEPSLYNASTEKHGGVTHHIDKGIDKEYRGRKNPFLTSRMKNVQETRPQTGVHTKTKGILVRENGNCVLGYDENG